MKNDYNTMLSQLAENFSLNTASKPMAIDGHAGFTQLSLPFESKAGFVYPESGDYSSKGSTFTSLLRYYCSNNKYSNDLIFNALQLSDRDVKENMKFRIPVFVPSSGKKYGRATFLLHGLNEKHWEKYLPWALRIMEETQAPVIMFPIAFHMNRAPESWGSPREMIKVAKERKQIVSNSAVTSFINAALSHRIQFAPHRFFSSGMQTYYDIIGFIDEIRMGMHPCFSPYCNFNFFSYSIGASLTEVLLTSNYNSFFDNSKAVLFCGGAALDTADPVSKTIIDSEAYTELFSWFGSLFESVTNMGRRVKEIFFQELPEVINFKSFLFYDKLQQHREAALKAAGGRIYEIGLEKDSVFPPDVISRTLKGFNGDINITTESMDFPYDYRHEDPFPFFENGNDLVSEGFNAVFSKSCRFLSA